MKKIRKQRPRTYAAQKLNARRTARAVKRATRRKPRRRQRYGIAGIPVTDHRLFLARGQYAVAVLLARAIGNANQLRVSCHVVGSVHDPEVARKEGMEIARMEATRSGELGWSVVETCVTSIYQ